MLTEYIEREPNALTRYKLLVEVGSMRSRIISLRAELERISRLQDPVAARMAEAAIATDNFHYKTEEVGNASDQRGNARKTEEIV